MGDHQCVADGSHDDPADHHHVEIRVRVTGHPRSVVRELERSGIEVIQVDFSESHNFAIAGLHCATLELVREQASAVP